MSETGPLPVPDQLSRPWGLIDSHSHQDINHRRFPSNGNVKMVPPLNIVCLGTLSQGYPIETKDPDQADLWSASLVHVPFIFSIYIHGRQYAYAPPHTPQIHRSQAQRAPLRPFQRAGPIEEQEQAAPAMMPPPPPPSASRFKPAQGRPQLTVNQGRTIPARHGQVQDQNQNQPATRDRRKMNMGPPPTPVFQTSFNTTLPGNHGSASMSRPVDTITNAPLQSSHQISTNRVASSNSYGFPPPSANGHHRNFPSVPSTSGPQRFMAQPAAVSGFSAPSRPASSMPTPRMPFAPAKPS
jgi:hypothetical protein